MVEYSGIQFIQDFDEIACSLEDIQDFFLKHGGNGFDRYNTPEDIIDTYYEKEQLSKFLGKLSMPPVRGILLVAYNTKSNTDKILGVFLGRLDERGTFHGYHRLIHPDHRRNGIMSELQTQVEDILRQHNINHMSSSPYIENTTAIDFLEKHGYSKTRTSWCQLIMTKDLLT